MTKLHHGLTIDELMARVEKNNNKAMKKIPSKDKQTCETCARSGIGCASRAGKCCNGLWVAKR